MNRKIYLPLLLILPLVFIAFFLIREAQVAESFGFPLDDSWIFWVFAKNLATGEGFSFNPGQPVLGITSILWVLVLAGSYFVTHNVVFISKFWGVVFFLLTIPLTYKICLFYTQHKKIAFLGVLTFAFLPPMIWGALSGMELSLATLLLCLTIFFNLNERDKNKNIYLAPIFGALCYVARPELILLYPLLLIHDYVGMKNDEVPKSHPTTKTTIFKKLVTFVLLLCPAFVLSYIITGSLLPNTFSAKTLDSGLIWAIKNGNLPALFISLTLNPFIWGGTMLATLVCLNIFWAFFWGKGLILSFLRKDTFIYPLIFLLIPMLRGVIAPVTNSFFGEHRYVSFLFPLLALFFVIGYKGFDQGAKSRMRKVSLRKWLSYATVAGLILTVFFYLNPLVKKDEIFRFFSGYYFPSIQTKSWLGFSDFKLIFFFVVAFIAGISGLGITKFFTDSLRGRKVVYLLLIAGLFLQIGLLINRSGRYALAIKNINEMQVHLGKWMDQNIPPGSLVAINDVGAIKFFGNRECLDLEGLVSPEIIPYKMLGSESYILYLNKHRPDYFMIFPSWYPPLVRFLALPKNVLYQVRLEDNIACGGGGHMIVAKPDWQLFDSTLQRSGLLDLRPYLPKKSFKRRWYDAQERQGLFPDWKVYQMKGGEAERTRNLYEAEKFYQKAESYDPQHHEFYLYLAEFYQKKGDPAKAETAFRKAVKYQLFPPSSDFKPKTKN